MTIVINFLKKWGRFREDTLKDLKAEHSEKCYPQHRFLFIYHNCNQLVSLEPTVTDNFGCLGLSKTLNCFIILHWGCGTNMFSKLKYDFQVDNFLCELKVGMIIIKIQIYDLDNCKKLIKTDKIETAIITEQRDKAYFSNGRSFKERDKKFWGRIKI